MDTSVDIEFAQKSELIVAQFGFRDLKSFVKNQALLMLMAKMEKYQAGNNRFEAKYAMSFDDFQRKIEDMKNEELFEKEDDYLDWRFAREAADSLIRQKQGLESA